LNHLLPYYNTYVGIKYFEITENITKTSPNVKLSTNTHTSSLSTLSSTKVSNLTSSTSKK
jgi:hypothetical protein